MLNVEQFQAIEDDTFVQRKHDHLTFAMAYENEAVGFSGLGNIHLTHEAIPDLNFDECDISSYRFGKKIDTPFLVSSMTAGNPNGISINRNLMSACQETGWAMGVGSQRRQLTDPAAASEWLELRQHVPDVVLFGNLGIAQLIHTSISDMERLVDSLEAHAMIIHCNPLQECIQPEGTPYFKGSWDAIEACCNNLSVPVIIKETGCGFSKSTLNRLISLGVAAVDISGFGGTHWGRIEGQRAKDEKQRSHAAETFSHWGINTVDSLMNGVTLTPDYEVWASGGVRNGLDAAKLLALGASTIGFAKPMLQAALESSETVINVMRTIEYELKVALFCTGNATIEALQESYHGA